MRGIEISIDADEVGETTGAHMHAPVLLVAAGGMPSCAAGERTGGVDHRDERSKFARVIYKSTPSFKA